MHWKLAGRLPLYWLTWTFDSVCWKPGLRTSLSAFCWNTRKSWPKSRPFPSEWIMEVRQDSRPAARAMYILYAFLIATAWTIHICAILLAGGRQIVQIRTGICHVDCHTISLIIKMVWQVSKHPKRSCLRRSFSILPASFRPSLSVFSTITTHTGK